MGKDFDKGQSGVFPICSGKYLQKIGTSKELSVNQQQGNEHPRLIHDGGDWRIVYLVQSHRRATVAQIEKFSAG